MPINQKLMPHLQKMTASHCAYCDGYPLGQWGDKTIDHFRPKAHFPREAYRWENLFLACTTCQRSKGSKYSEGALKPDLSDYDFERYFTFNFRNGAIEPRTIGTTAEEQDRARQTIAWFGLNDFERKEWRLRVYEEQYAARMTFTSTILESLPYRFLVTSLQARGVDFSG